MTEAQVIKPKGFASSMADMGRSLGLMVLLAAAVLLLTPARGLVFPDKANKMQPVDYSSELSGWRALTGVSALAPAGLPKSWRANAASLDHSDPQAGFSMHIGFVTADNKYAGLEESTKLPQAELVDVLGDTGQKVTGTATIGGEEWQRRTSDRGEQAFTRTSGKVLVIVTGNATQDELQTLCADLVASTA
jgi:hypothetical protein